MLNNFELRIVNIGSEDKPELGWMLLDLENKNNIYKSKEYFPNVDDMTAHLCKAINLLCVQKLDRE